MGWFSFLKSSAASVPTPGTGKVAIFVDSTTGIPNYKGEDGIAHTLKGDSGGGMTNPMTAKGDLIVGDTGGSPIRLPVGTTGQLLTVVGGTWAAANAVAPVSDTAVSSLSISSGVVNIDLSLGDLFTLSLTANITSITFSNLPSAGRGRSISIRIKQDATGSRTFALPSSFKAITGSDTAVQSPANAYTILNLSTLDQGTRWEYAMKACAA